MSTARDRIEAKLGLTGQPLQPIRAGPPKIPDHDLVRPIGQGAYGEVWLARNALGTRRAIKIVYLDNFRDSRPYEREFAGIRRFEPLSRANEGFVDILHVGRDEPGGWFYYVMELADDARSRVDPPHHPEGPSPSPAPIDSHSPDTPPDSENYRPRTLSDDLLRRGRLPLTECLELGLNLSLALAHLHRHGLIHRDVKPSNIIFVGGVPKLADIGLVTEAAGARTFVGTEGFVPPEGPTSPRADLYALGKVLYEAAMGKDRQEFPEPFTRIGTDPESIQLMDLNAVLLRACEPEPEARYASAEEMHADLALLHSGG
ncbi:MAG: serine/threonine protein kinase, partial [Verrucomicrobiales bacterium]|nr:serine/threonine protein kinase [Verrucomicrobiales bacterium]